MAQKHADAIDAQGLHAGEVLPRRLGVELLPQPRGPTRAGPIIIDAHGNERLAVRGHEAAAVGGDANLRQRDLARLFGVSRHGWHAQPADGSSKNRGLGRVGPAQRSPTKSCDNAWWDCAALVPPYFGLRRSLATLEAIAGPKPRGESDPAHYDSSLGVQSGRTVGRRVAAGDYSIMGRRLCKATVRRSAVTDCGDQERRCLFTRKEPVAIAGGSQPPECAWISKLLSGGC